MRIENGLNVENVASHYLKVLKGHLGETFPNVDRKSIITNPNQQ